MYLSLEDLFKIACRKCESEDVDLIVDMCEKCGPTVNAVCNKCGQEYDYHKFKAKKEA